MLKTIAALVSHGGGLDFDLREFRHLTQPGSVAGMLEAERVRALGASSDFDILRGWIASSFPGFEGRSGSGPIDGLTWATGTRSEGALASTPFLTAAYSPAPSLRHISKIDPLGDDQTPKGKLAFESSVRNEQIQAWIVRLFSQRALATVRNETSPEYGDFIHRFESALSTVYDREVHLDIDTPTLTPRLRIFNQVLNFSQLPGGVESTAAWIRDFMMRQAVAGPGPALLLLDEVEAHLHPLWQRRLLPAMRAALPGVQIIASSHSPFAISSCPEGRIHVFETNENGRARLRESIDAPSGNSVMTILRDIFGVSSRFDIKTEEELNRWNNYLREKAIRKLNKKESMEFASLTTRLAARSEELRSIVSIGGMAG